jgi:hypothetical protein
MGPAGLISKHGIAPWSSAGREGERVTPLVLLALAATAADGWRLELRGGASHAFDAPLTVEQDGQPALTFGASWAARPFETPLYYAWRVALFRDGRAWAIGLVHHKRYLAERTAEVESFSISHGYNLLTLERGWPMRGLTLWVAAGVVVAHPESAVRGRTFEEEGGLFNAGYYVTGPSLGVGLERRWSLTRRLDLAVEGRFCVSWARVPVAGGEASAPDRSVHLLLAVAFRP